jgi:chromosome segregation ATPase
VNIKALNERVNALDRVLTSELKSQDEKVRLAMAASDKAIEKAETAMEKRFDSVNEFRKLADDILSTRAAKEELQAAVEKLEAKIDPLILYVTAQQGSTAGASRTWATIAGTALILIALAGLYLKGH